MPHLRSEAQLFINGRKVGRVELRGWETSWMYGDFVPEEAFSRFAPLFGAWSLLMHADSAGNVSSEAREELRQAEVAMDQLKARLYVGSLRQWFDVAQLNIDGPLIECKIGCGSND